MPSHALEGDPTRPAQEASMHVSLRRFASFTIFALFGAALGSSTAQEPPQLGAPAQPGQEQAPVVIDVDTPKGVEVLARGPVHEAFATPTAEAKPTQYVPKKPPADIEEMPPEEKPDGDVVWVGGYWAWDDDRDDYLWVSGCWRVQPDGKEWVPGYWREQANQWQWVPGFWTAVQETQRPEVTYYPEPPPPPQLAPPGNPPEADMFYAPGYWMWVGNHYVWRAGYWTRVRQGHVYVSSHYRWTPHGYVFVSGYWDYDVARRGVLYAPVVVDTVVVGPRFVYTPYYAVTDTIVVDALFVRPGFCHYYFGDYYGPRYVSLGFHCGYHYSRVHYDPIIVYNRWCYRDSPGWFDVRLSISLGRSAGRVPCPPRTLVQQVNVTNVRNVNVKNVNVNRTVINNTTVNNNVANTEVLAPAKKVMASKGVKTVKMDAPARAKERESSQQLRTAVVKQRQNNEMVRPGTQPANKPRSANLDLPPSSVRAKNMEKIRPAADDRGPGKQPGIKNAADPRGTSKNPARIDDDRPNTKPRPIGAGNPGNPGKNAQPLPKTQPQGSRPPAANQPNARPAPRQAPPPPRKNDDKKRR